MGKWRYGSTILHLGTRCGRVIIYTTLPFHPRGNIHWYPLDMRLGGKILNTERNISHISIKIIIISKNNYYSIRILQAVSFIGLKVKF
jgi:hypothetical protein